MIELPGIVEPPRENVVVSFMVPGRPVSKNEMHIHSRFIPAGAKILREDARQYMRDVARFGAAARDRTAWPRNLCAPRRVLLSIQIYGTRHDSAAANTIIRDALEGVLYRNDNCVDEGPQERPIAAPAPFVTVTAELLELWPPKAAERRLREALARDAAK